MNFKYRILLIFVASMVGSFGLPILGGSLIFPIVSLVGIFVSVHNLKSFKQLLILCLFCSLGFNVSIHFFQTYTLQEFFNFNPYITLPFSLIINSITEIGVLLFLICYFKMNQKKELENLSFFNIILISTLYSLIQFISPIILDDQIGLAINNSKALNSTTQYVGYSFYSFLYILSAISLTKFLFYKKINKGIILSLILWSSSFIFGFYLINGQKENTKTLKVGIIQPNFNHHQREKSRNNLSYGLEVLNNHFELTLQLLKKEPTTEIILWPETTYPFIFNDPKSLKEEEIENKLKNFLKEKNITLMVGSFIKQNDKIENGILVFNHFDGKNNFKILTKKELFPLGEKIPLKDFFPFLDQVFPNDLNLKSNNHVTTDIVTSIGKIKVGSAICYEIYLPRHLESLSKEKIQLIINPSTESWFGWGSWQISLGMAISKSIQFNIPLIRSTNTGYSAISDFKETVTLNTNTKGFLTKDIQIKSGEETFFNKYGDIFIYLSLIFLMVAGVRKWFF